MKTAVFAITQEAGYLGERLSKALEGDLYCYEREQGGFAKTVQKAFGRYECLVFIMACGIVVRTIAGLLEDKTKDPAIIVLDEKGKNVISLLSGHIGGANQMARRIAGITGGNPVITTATDINQLPAFDAFAVQNGCMIENMHEVKHISTHLLENHEIAMLTDCPVLHAPQNVKIIPLEGLGESLNNVDIESCVLLSNSTRIFPYRYQHRLVIRPKNIVLGAGCKKNTDSALFEEVALKFLEKNQISMHSVKALATISIKENEKAFQDFVNKYGLILKTIVANNLMEYEDEFEVSQFVKETTGIGNVAESCAKYAFRHTKVICKKTIYKGITMAMGEIQESYDFQGCIVAAE